MMNKLGFWVGVFVVGMLGAWAGVKVFAPAAAGGASAAKKETALERVLRTGTLRCAYTLYPTFMDKDPNTGAFSGLSYDVVEALGTALGVKVVWGPEVGSNEIFEGFKNNAFDANCTGYWRTPERAHGGDFSKPLFFTSGRYFVRKGETRFKTPDDFNRPGVTFALLDGEALSAMVPHVFPKAKILSFSGMSSAAERFDSVATGKADVIPIDMSAGIEYMAHNPGKLELFDSAPMAVMPSVILIPHDEFGLKEFLDAGISALKEQGILKEIVARHVNAPGAMLLPADEVKE